MDVKALEALHRAKWTQAARDEHKKNGGYFAGPDDTFPLKDASDVEDAWGLAGHADNPDEVRRNIINWAKENGHTDALPDTAKESMKERSMPAAITPESLPIYFPITRIDSTSRTVTGQATVEKPDSYGTIFGYCPDAWLKWRGNMREQHDPTKAVGKAFNVVPDPEERAIYVDSRVSRGAQSTWLKLEDGVLSGYSASVIPDPEFGNDPKKWPKKEYEGKLYPYLPRYTVAELSYVDNPATPGCNITLVRATGVVTDVVDVTEESVTPEPTPLERAGARLSKETMAGNHTSIKHMLHAAAAAMRNCADDCPQCSVALKHIDPDGDLDIDLGGYDDPDNDWQSLYNDNDGDMERSIVALIERALTPVYARLQGIAGALSRSYTPATNTTAIESFVSGAITRAIEAATSATTSNLAEVRAELSAVKETVGKIADTPMPGAPIQNTSALPRPTDKTLPTDPYQMPYRSGSAVYDAVAALSAAGRLDTVDKQVDAVAAALAAQRRG